jgi:type IV secretory pathway VirB9-like protein
MRVMVPLVALGLLAGCAASTPRVVSTPIPDDIGWSAPIIEPLDEPKPSVVTSPERKASPFAQVFDFEEGHVYTIRVAVNYTLDVMLQADEQIDEIVPGHRAPLAPGEEVSPWDIREGKSHSPQRRHLFINVTKPGLSQGITVTTNRRVYLLDVRSVAASKVRLVRWDYGPEPIQAASKPRLLPDPAQSQQYFGGYQMELVRSDAPPSWMPRQVVNDQQGKTYIIFPAYLTTITAPLLRLVGSMGAELVNYRQVGTTYILDGLFNLAELRVGNGETAEVVRIYRGAPQRISCPGDAACPVWPDVALAGGARGNHLR